MNDYAGLLTAAEHDRLETLLTERERTAGPQMAIAVFKSLDGESLEDVANKRRKQTADLIAPSTKKNRAGANAKEAAP